MTPRKEIASSIVLLLFSLTFLIYTTRYPIEGWESPGPAVFPLIAGGVLLLLAAWQLIRATLVKKTSGEGAEKGAKVKTLKAFFQENPGSKVLMLTALLITYILLMQWIGFFVSTFLLVIIASRLMEAKGWIMPVALSVGIGLFCYSLFEVWLKLSFPRGILF